LDFAKKAAQHQGLHVFTFAKGFAGSPVRGRWLFGRSSASKTIIAARDAGHLYLYQRCIQRMIHASIAFCV
jgi:hypothetical protein